MAPLARFADTVVVGGGTAGSVVAARLSERTGRSVVLLEAGPDYGPADGGGWPQDLLDPFQIPVSHDWGYTSAARTGKLGQPLERARVLGGCSAHNGCAAVWGHRADYDGWRDLGNPGWSAAELQPVLAQVSRKLRVRSLALEQVSPWHRACLAAAQAAGMPAAGDFNNLDTDVGVGLAPVNIHTGKRWNAAFAYLDEARHRPELTIIDRTVAARLRFEAGRVTGVEVLGPDGPGLVGARQVVLCAGTYGTPAILLRSGIGPADELRSLGLMPVHDLPGVGRNLHDHPAVYLQFGASAVAAAALDDFGARGGEWFVLPLIAKLRSAGCTSAYDLHLFPMCWPAADAGQGWELVMAVANLTPRARGSVRLSDLDPLRAPLIDTRFLDDVDGVDAAVLWSGVEQARAWVRHPALAAWCGPELAETAQLTDAESLPRASAHYFHPVGTCRMGPDPAAGAVVDTHGRVHGWPNLFVADASVMPTVPRANTNLPTLVVAERLAHSLAMSRP
jgi:choline dehydrogenase